MSLDEVPSAAIRILFPDYRGGSFNKRCRSTQAQIPARRITVLRQELAPPAPAGAFQAAGSPIRLEITPGNQFF
jgi:hypothetical protein